MLVPYQVLGDEMRLISFIVALCACLFASNTLRAAENSMDVVHTRYTVIPLGILQGGQQMFPTAISNTGFAVGFSQQDDGTNTAFYFHREMGLMNAGYGDSNGTYLRDVNNLGEAVGEVSTFIIGEYGVYAYEFTPIAASATNLFGGYCEIKTNNNSGMYAGRAEGEDFPQQAFRYRPGFDWEGLKKPGMEYTAVSEINDRGVVIGFSYYTSGDALATVWDENGNASTIEIHGYQWSSGIAINDHNVCVVVANNVGPESSFAHSFVVSNGNVVDIGTIGGTNCWAEAINDAGVVVGSSTDSNGNEYGFVYQKGVITNLNLLVDRHEFVIDYAVDINDSGVILAKANGSQAVLLVPSHHN